VEGKTCCEAVALRSGADKVKTALDLAWAG